MAVSANKLELLQIADITMPRSIDFSRATASAICSSSSLLALTAMVSLLR